MKPSKPVRKLPNRSTLLALRKGATAIDYAKATPLDVADASPPPLPRRIGKVRR